MSEISRLEDKFQKAERTRRFREEEKSTILRTSRDLAEMATRLARVESAVASLNRTMQTIIQTEHKLKMETLRKLNRYLDDWRP